MTRMSGYFAHIAQLLLHDPENRDCDGWKLKHTFFPDDDRDRDRGADKGDHDDDHDGDHANNYDDDYDDNDKEDRGEAQVAKGPKDEWESNFDWKVDMTEGLFV